MKLNEVMIIRNGKLQYAIKLTSETDKGGRNDNTYIYMDNGKIYFSDSYFNTQNTFDVGEEAHRIAKEIFMIQIQTDIKTRVMELKQLEEVLYNLGLKELILDSIPNSAKMLLEAKTEILNAVTETVQEVKGELTIGIQAAKDEVTSNIKERALKRKTAANNKT